MLLPLVTAMVAMAQFGQEVTHVVLQMADSVGDHVILVVILSVTKVVLCSHANL
jgi:hypothetical protein